MKQRLADEYCALFANSKAILKAALAEVVELRREYAREDAKAESVNVMLGAIRPEQYVCSGYDNVRAVIGG